MKHVTVKKLLYLSGTVIALNLAPAAAFAEAEQPAETAAEAPAETAEAPAEAAEVPEEKEIRDVTFDFEGSSYILGNRTDKNYDRAEASLKEVPAEEQAEGQTEAPAEPSAEILLVDDEGTEHVFEKAQPAKWSVPILVDDLGFLYIQYLNEAQENQEIYENGEEKELEEKIVVYPTADVNIRAAADVESDVIYGALLGTELTAVGSAPGWVKIEINGTFGYISHKYITRDTELIKQLKSLTPTPTPTPVPVVVNTAVSDNTEYYYYDDEDSYDPYDSYDDEDGDDGSSYSEPSEPENYEDPDTNTGSGDDDEELIEDTEIPDPGSGDDTIIDDMPSSFEDDMELLE